MGLARQGEGKGKEGRDYGHTQNSSLLRVWPVTNGNSILTRLAESRPAFAMQPLVIHTPLRVRGTPCQSCDRVSGTICFATKGLYRHQATPHPQTLIQGFSTISILGRIYFFFFLCGSCCMHRRMFSTIPARLTRCQ